MFLEVASQRMYLLSITGRRGGDPAVAPVEWLRTCTEWHKPPLPEKQPSLKEQTQHFDGIYANILVIIIEIYHSYDFLMQGITQSSTKLMRWSFFVWGWVGGGFFFTATIFFFIVQISNLNVAALSILQLYWSVLTYAPFFDVHIKPVILCYTSPRYSRERLSDLHANYSA